MFDVEISLENRPGALAELGETLGKIGISVLGGGVFVHNNRGIAHFLFEDGRRAKDALEAVGIRVASVREVLVQRLEQGTPGQLGSFARRMADSGVNIEVQYSDHDNQLIVVVDDLENGRKVSEAWEGSREAPTVE